MREGRGGGIHISHPAKKRNRGGRAGGPLTHSPVEQHDAKKRGGNDTTQRNETASLPLLLRHVPQLIWDLIKRFEDIVSGTAAGIQRGSRKEEVHESPGRTSNEEHMMKRSACVIYGRGLIQSPSRTSFEPPVSISSSA